MFSMGSPIPFVPLGAGRSGSARPWALLFSRPHNSPPLSRERLNYTPGPSVLRPITPNQSSVRRPLGTINEQAFLPNPRDLMGVPSYSSKVARYAVVGIVAPHHRGQMGALVGDRLMPVDPTPSRNRRQRSGVTGLCRYLPHHILACPRLAPDVGEAEEGERGTIRL